jgi:hypothetical protein
MPHIFGGMIDSLSIVFSHPTSLGVLFDDKSSDGPLQ